MADNQPEQPSAGEAVYNQKKRSEKVAELAQQRDTKRARLEELLEEKDFNVRQLHPVAKEDPNKFYLCQNQKYLRSLSKEIKKVRNQIALLDRRILVDPAYETQLQRAQELDLELSDNDPEEVDLAPYGSDYDESDEED